MVVVAFQTFSPIMGHMIRIEIYSRRYVKFLFHVTSKLVENLEKHLKYGQPFEKNITFNKNNKRGVIFSLF